MVCSMYTLGIVYLLYARARYLLVNMYVDYITSEYTSSHSR